jgi:hypothetical protein
MGQIEVPWWKPPKTPWYIRLSADHQRVRHVPAYTDGRVRYRRQSLPSSTCTPVAASLIYILRYILLWSDLFHFIPSASLAFVSNQDAVPHSCPGPRGFNGCCASQCQSCPTCSSERPHGCGCKNRARCPHRRRPRPANRILS